MNKLLCNQSLPTSITHCAWYWLTPTKTLTSQRTAAAGGWVSEYGRSSPFPLSAYHVLHFWSQSGRLWGHNCEYHTRPTVVCCMLLFGLATCWGPLCLCSTGKHLHLTVVSERLQLQPFRNYTVKKTQWQGKVVVPYVWHFSLCNQYILLA